MAQELERGDVVGLVEQQDPGDVQLPADPDDVRLRLLVPLGAERQDRVAQLPPPPQDAVQGLHIVGVLAGGAHRQQDPVVQGVQAAHAEGPVAQLVAGLQDPPLRLVGEADVLVVVQHHGHGGLGNARSLRHVPRRHPSFLHGSSPLRLAARAPRCLPGGPPLSLS